MIQNKMWLVAAITISSTPLSAMNRLTASLKHPVSMNHHLSLTSRPVIQQRLNGSDLSKTVKLNINQPVHVPFRIFTKEALRALLRGELGFPEVNNINIKKHVNIEELLKLNASEFPFFEQIVKKLTDLDCICRLAIDAGSLTEDMRIQILREELDEFHERFKAFMQLVLNSNMDINVPGYERKRSKTSGASYSYPSGIKNQDEMLEKYGVMTIYPGKLMKEYEKEIARLEKGLSKDIPAHAKDDLLARIHKIYYKIDLLKRLFVNKN